MPIKLGSIGVNVQMVGALRRCGRQAFDQKEFARIRIITPIAISGGLQARNCHVPLSQVAYENLDVDHRLGGETWNGCRPDVLDPQGRLCEAAEDQLPLGSEFGRPGGVVGLNPDFIHCPAPA